MDVNGYGDPLNGRQAGEIDVSNQVSGRQKEGNGALKKTYILTGRYFKSERQHDGACCHVWAKGLAINLGLSGNGLRRSRNRPISNGNRAVLLGPGLVRTSGLPTALQRVHRDFHRLVALFEPRFHGYL